MLGYKVNAAQDLQYLTQPTGGLAYAREAKDLKFALLNVQQALGLQWSAKATLYPSAGPETATVQLNLSDQTIINTQPVFFNVTKSFAQPPQINLRGAVLSTLQGIRFGMDFVSPQLISQLKLNVVDKVTGDSILAQSLGQVQDTYDIPIANLKVGSTYDIQIVALDKTGAQIGTPVVAEFQYQPPAAQFNITKVITPTQAAPYYTVQVESINLVGWWAIAPGCRPTARPTPSIRPKCWWATRLRCRPPISRPGYTTSRWRLSTPAATCCKQPPRQKLPPFAPPSSLDLALAFLAGQPDLDRRMGGVFCLALVVLLVAVVIILPKPNAAAESGGAVRARRETPGAAHRTWRPAGRSRCRGVERPEPPPSRRGQPRATWPPPRAGARAAARRVEVPQSMVEDRPRRGPSRHAQGLPIGLCPGRSARGHRDWQDFVHHWAARRQ